jgi:repressor LexA
MIDLTTRQKQILDLIIGHINTYGYPPSVRDIAERFSFSPNAANDHLRAIARKDYIRIDEQTARGIHVLKFPEGISATVAVLPTKLVEEYREIEKNEEL